MSPHRGFFVSLCVVSGPASRVNPGPNISLSQLLGPFLTYDAGQWAPARPSRRGLRTMCGFRPYRGENKTHPQLLHLYITGRMLQSDDGRALLALPAEEKVFIKTNETSACNKTESLYMKHIFTSYEMSSPSVFTI